MKTCVEAARKRHGYKMQSTWISKGLITVETSEELLSQFQKVVLTEMGDSFNLDLTKMIYKRIALYSFRAYAKFTDKQDHCSTSSAKSLSNIELRKLIACGASENKNTKKKKAYNEKIRNWRTMVGELEPTKPASSSTTTGSFEMGQQVSVSTGQEVAPSIQMEQHPAAKRRRKKNRTTAEIEDTYRSIYASALAQYDKNEGNLKKLTIEQCCSILFVAFGKYQSPNLKATKIKPLLGNVIVENPNWRKQ